MTNSIRLVHTADIHLGTPFSALPELAAMLQQEQLQLFMNMIDHCRQTDADILLIAGDMFEQAIPDPSLTGAVSEAFRLLSKTRIFIAPGNHDPVFPDSPWLKNSWPDNVHVFRTGLEKAALDDLKTCVYGAAFCSTAAVKPLTGHQTPDLDATKINILLLHGDLVGPGQTSVYNPVDKGWLQHSGFDYVALGHVHKGHDIPERMPQSDTLFAYSGCPAGRGFDEAGKRGIISGSLIRVEQPGLSGRGFRVDHNLCQTSLPGRQYKLLDIDISGCQNHDDIYLAVRDGIRHSGAAWQQDLFKIILSGAIADDLQPSPALLQSRLAPDVFFCKITDRTTRAYNLAALSGEHSLMGAFVRRVLGQDEPDWSKLSAEKIQMLQSGLQAFEGEVLYREAD